MMVGARTGAWAKRESIPSGWVDVEYVQSNGDGAYIDTGIRGEKGLPLSVEFSRAKESIDLFRIFGSRSSASSNGFSAGTYSGYSNNYIVINYGTKSFFFDGHITASTGLVYRIETDETSIRCYTDGKLRSTHDISSEPYFQTPTNISLFTRNCEPSASVVRIFNAYVGGIRLIGVRNVTTNEVAMCDILTGDIYHNAGTGAFVSGPDKTT